jgi:hypothetical protein
MQMAVAHAVITTRGETLFREHAAPKNALDEEGLGS